MRLRHDDGAAVTAVVVVFIVVMLVAAGAAYLLGALDPRGSSAEDLQRVLLVAASHNEDGEVVGQIIAIVHVEGEPGVTPVSPGTHVAIAGTSFSTVGDAYPFGGGSGTAAAVARARGEAELPYVSLPPQALAEAVDAAGGMPLTLPAPMSVFDGERLYTFREGEQTLRSYELAALLKGAPYLETDEREQLEAELAYGLAAVLAQLPEIRVTGMGTDLSDDGRAVLHNALGSAAP